MQTKIRANVESDKVAIQVVDRWLRARYTATNDK